MISTNKNIKLIRKSNGYLYKGYGLRYGKIQGKYAIQIYWNEMINRDLYLHEDKPKDSFLSYLIFGHLVLFVLGIGALVYMPFVVIYLLLVEDDISRIRGSYNWNDPDRIAPLVNILCKVVLVGFVINSLT